MADSVCHRQNRQTERQRDASEPDAEVRKCGSQNRTSTAAQDEPKRTYKFRRQSLS
jgi:hypothetical protein